MSGCTFALSSSEEMLEEFESGIPRQAPPAGSGGEEEEPLRSPTGCEEPFRYSNNEQSDLPGTTKIFPESGGGDRERSSSFKLISHNNPLQFLIDKARERAKTDEIVTGVNLTWWKAVCETLKKEHSEMVMSTPRFEMSSAQAPGSQSSQLY